MNLYYVKTKEKMDRQIIYYLVGGVVLIVLGKTLLKKLPGLGGTPLDPDLIEEQKEAAKDIVSSRMFDPLYWKEVPAAKLMPRSAAEMWAKKIKDAWGWFNDDEEQILNALNQAQSYAQVSQIADAYGRLYSKDLFTTFAKNLNRHEINLIWQLLKNKPRT